MLIIQASIVISRYIRNDNYNNGNVRITSMKDTPDAITIYKNGIELCVVLYKRIYTAIYADEWADCYDIRYEPEKNIYCPIDKVDCCLINNNIYDNNYMIIVFPVEKIPQPVKFTNYYNEN